ncbi:DUF1360 domain-containing protein [Streptomyces africanus]|uniref:DUF1360 domain-containing protein n=1 Tax=Streptomyces africanus TaxID=231024 RepID=UPI000A369E16|nr:DUF1360 domain-containing protein [Streptomyces africanus]
MPVWLLIACMILANYRASRLAVRDDFPPVLWLRDRLAGGWRPLTTRELERHPEVGDLGTDTATHHIRLGTVMRIDGRMNRYVRRAKWSPYWLAELVSCPWCVSGWLAAALTAAVDLTVGVPAPFLVWGAVWAASALLASREWA